MPPWLATNWRAVAEPASELILRVLVLLVIAGVVPLMPVKASLAEEEAVPPRSTS